MKFLLTTFLIVFLSCQAIASQPLKALYEKESAIDLNNPHDLKLSPRRSLPDGVGCWQ